MSDDERKDWVFRGRAWSQVEEFRMGRYSDETWTLIGGAIINEEGVDISALVEEEITEWCDS